MLHISELVREHMHRSVARLPVHRLTGPNTCPMVAMAATIPNVTPRRFTRPVGMVEHDRRMRIVGT